MERLCYRCGSERWGVFSKQIHLQMTCNHIFSSCTFILLVFSIHFSFLWDTNQTVVFQYSPFRCCLFVTNVFSMLENYDLCLNRIRSCPFSFLSSAQPIASELCHGSITGHMSCWHLLIDRWRWMMNEEFCTAAELLKHWVALDAQAWNELLKI